VHWAARSRAEPPVSPCDTSRAARPQRFLSRPHRYTHPALARLSCPAKSRRRPRIQSSRLRPRPCPCHCEAFWNSVDCDHALRSQYPRTRNRHLTDSAATPDRDRAAKGESCKCGSPDRQDQLLRDIHYRTLGLKGASLRHVSCSRGWLMCGVPFGFHR
jgi:hypothetical protein